MVIIWKADIYIQNNSKRKAKQKLEEMGAVSHANGCWTIETENKDAVTRMFRRYRLKYMWYKKEWSRSGNYRDTFFQTYDPPYRCRYCHRKLQKQNIEVDHLVPVARAKKSAYARILLRIQGIRNVNDERNLVASCHRCNARKSDKMGLWYIKGRLGKYKAYWVVHYILIIILLIAVIYLAIRFAEFANTLIDVV